MSLCLIAGATVTRIAAASFTLMWVHSIEKTRWEEDWRTEGDRLRLVEARIEHLGAGMEMPADAMFDGKWWRWKPAMEALSQVALRRSDSQPQGWRLCAANVCRPVADASEKADLVTMKACE